MRLSRKWVVTIMAITVILLMGTIGGIVSAQTPAPTVPAPTQSTGQDTLLARVAEILDVDQADLEAAIRQARQEMRSDAMKDRLEKLVEQGQITQEEADQYLEWWQARPDIFENLQGNFNGMRDAGQQGKMRLRGGFHCEPRSGSNLMPELTTIQ